MNICRDANFILFDTAYPKQRQARHRPHMTIASHWTHLMGWILAEMVSCRCRCSPGQHSTTELHCWWICSCPELCHLLGLYRSCTGSQSWALQQIAPWPPGISEVELRWGSRLRGPGSGCWWWGTSWWFVFLIGKVLIKGWIQLNTSQWMASYFYSCVCNEHWIP